jgi:hypothetical protein
MAAFGLWLVVNGRRDEWRIKLNLHECSSIRIRTDDFSPCDGAERSPRRAIDRRFGKPHTTVGEQTVYTSGVHATASLRLNREKAFPDTDATSSSHTVYHNIPRTTILLNRQISGCHNRMSGNPRSSPGALDLARGDRQRGCGTEKHPGGFNATPQPSDRRQCHDLRGLAKAASAPSSTS